ncbi:MAG: hypothetical protein R2762_05085 [Bryobacteraceae bacterium]
MVYPLLTEIYSALFLRLAMDMGGQARLGLALGTYASRLAYDDDGEIVGARAMMRQAAGMIPSQESPRNSGMTQLLWATIEMLSGHWHASFEHAKNARSTFEDKCRGVAWETATASSYYLTARTLMGDWQANAVERPKMMENARARGDRYAEVTLPLVTGFYASYLAGDRPDEAEDLVHRYIARWPRGEFDVQQLYALQALVDLDLYRGDGWRAWNRVETAWDRVRASGLLGISLLQWFTLSCRGRAAVAFAATQGASEGEKRKLLSIATDSARVLLRAKRKYANGLGCVVAAGVRTIRNDRATAADLLGRAEECFAAAELHPWRSAALLALAELTEEPRASQLREQGLVWMKSQEVRRAQCLVRMFCPPAS